MVRCFFLCCCILFCLPSLAAQDEDFNIADIEAFLDSLDNFKKSDFISVGAVVQENANVELDKLGIDSRTQYNEYNFDSSFRFLFCDIFAMDIGLSIDNYRIEIEEINGNLNAYIISLNTSFHLMITDQLLVSMTTSPALASDFDGFDYRHLYFSGSMEVAFLLNKNVAISGGAKLYQRGDGWGVLPLLGLHMEFNKVLTIDILAPLKAEINYELTDVFSVFAAYNNTYNAQVRAVVFNDGIEEDNIINNQRVGGGIRAKVADNVTISLFLGATISSELNSAEDSQDFIDTAAKFLAMIGFEVRFKRINLGFGKNSENSNSNSNSNGDGDVDNIDLTPRFKGGAKEGVSSIESYSWLIF